MLDTVQGSMRGQRNGIRTPFELELTAQQGSLKNTALCRFTYFLHVKYPVSDSKGPMDSEEFTVYKGY